MPELLIIDMVRVNNMVELMDIAPKNPTVELHGEREMAKTFIKTHNKVVVVVEYRDNLISEMVMAYENGRMVSYGNVYTVNDLYVKQIMARGINWHVRRGIIVTQRVVKSHGKPAIVVQKLKMKIDGVNYNVLRVIINTVGVNGGLSNGKMVIAISPRKIGAPIYAEIRRLLTWIERWFKSGAL